MSLRVLHLVHWLNRGGIETWLVDLIRSSDRTVLEMDVCCKGPNVGELASQLQAGGASVHHVPLGRSHLGFGKRLGSLLREKRYDVLHVHAGSFAGLPCRVADRCGVTPVVTIHSTRFGFETAGTISVLGPLRRLYTVRSFRTAHRHARAVIGCSQAALDAMTGLAGLTPDQRYHVIPYGTAMKNGRDPQRRAQTRAEFGIAPEAPLAIHVGVMRDAKNHPGLIRIARHIASALPAFRLILVGDGALRPSIERQIRELNLETNVWLLGTRSDVERLLEAADLLIFPSRWEGLPVAVLEAQAKGLPVIGTDIPPLREATDPGKSALLFPIDQEQQMADAAVSLLNDPQRRESMGRIGADFVAERFSIQSNVARHLEIYQQLTA
jgi:glycosyltransferase involved in cell wall biosynthesis